MFQDQPGQVQSDPGALDVLHIPAPVKPLEDLCQFFLPYPSSGVTDCDLGVHLHRSDRDRDPASGLCIFHCVFQKIDQHLGSPFPVVPEDTVLKRLCQNLDLPPVRLVQ